MKCGDSRRLCALRASELAVYLGICLKEAPGRELHVLPCIRINFLRSTEKVGETTYKR